MRKALIGNATEMSDNQEDLSQFSARPLNAEELRRIRRDLAMLDRVRTLVTTYENAKVVGRFFIKVAVWIVAITSPVLGGLVALSNLGWWPFTGDKP